MSHHDTRARLIESTTARAAQWILSGDCQAVSLADLAYSFPSSVHDSKWYVIERADERLSVGCAVGMENIEEGEISGYACTVLPGERRFEVIVSAAQPEFATFRSNARTIGTCHAHNTKDVLRRTARTTEWHVVANEREVCRLRAPWIVSGQGIPITMSHGREGKLPLAIRRGFGDFLRAGVRMVSFLVFKRSLFGVLPNSNLVLPDVGGGLSQDEMEICFCVSLLFRMLIFDFDFAM